jgi:hypothetical protein
MESDESGNCASGRDKQEGKEKGEGEAEIIFSKRRSYTFAAVHPSWI